jgi:hypothetical protein
VAVAGLATAVVSLAYRESVNEQERSAIFIGTVVGSAVGLWSMRQPFLSLAVLLASGLFLPAVDHPPLAVRGMVAGCSLGWILGAPAGWIRRCLVASRNSDSPSSE